MAMALVDHFSSFVYLQNNKQAMRSWEKKWALNHTPRLMECIF